MQARYFLSIKTDQMAGIARWFSMAMIECGNNEKKTERRRKRACVCKSCQKLLSYVYGSNEMTFHAPNTTIQIDCAESDERVDIHILMICIFISRYQIYFHKVLCYPLLSFAHLHIGLNESLKRCRDRVKRIYNYNNKTSLYTECDQNDE